MAKQWNTKVTPEHTSQGELITTTVETVQAGLIGGGRWGQVLLRNFRRLTSVPLVVDPRASTLKLQQEFPNLSVTPALDRFLDDAALSVAVIASPAETHYDLTRRCIEAGKDVFVEKPFTLSSVEALELVAQAHLHNRILMVGHKYLFHPAIHRLKTELDRGTRGTCQALVAYRLGWGATPDGAGVLWHLGSHEVSIFQYVLGQIAHTAVAMGVSILNRKECDLVTATLTYPSGVMGIFQLSMSHPEKVRRIIAIGESTAIQFDDLADEKLTKWGNLRLDPARNFDERTGVLEGGQTIACGHEEPVFEECNHFLACVRNRIEPTGSGEWAVAVIRTLEALSESLRLGGQPVPV
ncbi:MAG: hypothetical protein C3F08_00505 [Candidatus Methylomirabilota bacterium]|nr:MAG: hypothetical protein C3F08_00505 [candidate division NC10 bacterium]